VIETSGRESLENPISPPQIRTPIVAVFSLTGGVGATSLLASLGRALSAAGEKVILIGTTSQALLPFYFGGRELRSGLMRTYSPPVAAGEPISLMLHDATQMNGDDAAQQRLTQQIFASAFGTQRILADVSPAAIWLLRRWARLRPAVLVPLIPSMDSMLRLESTERLFRELSTAPAEPLLPYYVLNHFDSQQSLHEELRTALRRRLGERLLHVAVPESRAIAQAVAEGLTVIDFAPDAAAAQQYRDLAGWLRTLSPPLVAEAAETRWGEL
jgi:cellulose synthase operon protein YhjQ